MGQVREQDGNVRHLFGQGIAVLLGQGGQLGVLGSLGVLQGYLGEPRTDGRR